MGKKTRESWARYRENNANNSDHDGPIFEYISSSQQAVRVAVWNGNHDFCAPKAEEIMNNLFLVGTTRIAVVQFGSPVGVNRRSSVNLIDVLIAKDAHLGFDGIVCWARDKDTYQSIIEEFTQAKLKVAQKHGKKRAEWVPEKVNFLVSNQ